MLSTSFNAAGKLKVSYQINRDGEKTFVFFDEDENGVETEHDVTGSTWELFIKRYKGDRDKVLSLTLGAGLSFPVYTTNTILAQITAVQSQVKEGECVWELYNITEKRTYISETWTFTFDPKEQ